MTSRLPAGRVQAPAVSSAGSAQLHRSKCPGRQHSEVCCTLLAMTIQHAASELLGLQDSAPGFHQQPRAAGSEGSSLLQYSRSPSPHGVCLKQCAGLHMANPCFL